MLNTMVKVLKSRFHPAYHPSACFHFSSRKQTRDTAGLRIYSMALADHVFRSTYLTQNSDFGRNKIGD
ncbi:hypothetical protein LB503_005638 [Fusarium chuoi]|nr:hypothetical protein LB503_005638 [Fusarium chuoi]